jgi:hypothetical protein
VKEEIRKPEEVKSETVKTPIDETAAVIKEESKEE